MDDTSIMRSSPSMMAAVLEGRGRLSLKEVERPPCPPGGAVVEVSVCSVCSTDVKMFHMGHRDLVTPRVLGHEMVGTVVESDTAIGAGERVQVYPGIVCGECTACHKGAENQCPGVRIAGFDHDGGFAQYASIPAGGRLNPIPDGVEDERAALAEPVACCLNAQCLASIGQGDTALILGAGPMGCIHSILARARGAERVMVVEPETCRRAMASKAGADAVMDPGELWDHPREIAGTGFDAIVLASRDVPVDDDLLSLLAPRGRISVFSGLPPSLANSSFDLNHLHYRECLLVGAYGCTNSQNRAALDMMAEGLDLGWLITGRFPLSRIHRALGHASERSGLKAVVDDMWG